MNGISLFQELVESPGDAYTLFSAKMSKLFCLLIKNTHLLFLYFVSCINVIQFVTHTAIHNYIIEYKNKMRKSAPA